MAVQASAVWRVRPSGDNTNGGGFDTGISGYGTDYSQQDTAQASGTAGTASGTTAFSDASAPFTAAMVGNAIYIASGTGFTAGWYFVTGYTSATAVTLDSSPGTGSAAVWKLGGAWADPVINFSSAGPLVPGNTVYVLGSGVPNPASYVYDYDLAGPASLVAGSLAGGFICVANDPATPSYGAGGMPCIRINGRLYQFGAYAIVDGLYLVAKSISYSAVALNGSGSQYALNCVIDQFGYSVTGTASVHTIGCEIFSSVAGSTSSTANGITSASGCVAISNNIHDFFGNGIYCSYQYGTVSNNIVAKCSGRGIYTNTSTGNFFRGVITGNTIDGNGGNGIEFGVNNGLPYTQCFNNIISGHTSAGAYGLAVLSGVPSTNSLLTQLFDYNVFYNNSSNYNGINAGPHDTALATDPYVASSTEDYTLA